MQLDNYQLPTFSEYNRFVYVICNLLLLLVHLQNSIFHSNVWFLTFLLKKKKNILACYGFLPPILCAVLCLHKHDHRVLLFFISDLIFAGISKLPLRRTDTECRPTGMEKQSHFVYSLFQVSLCTTQPLWQTTVLQGSNRTPHSEPLQENQWCSGVMQHGTKSSYRYHSGVDQFPTTTHTKVV